MMNNNSLQDRNILSNNVLSWGTYGNIIALISIRDLMALNNIPFA